MHTLLVHVRFFLRLVRVWGLDQYLHVYVRLVTTHFEKKLRCLKKKSNCIEWWTTATHFEIFFQNVLNLGLTKRTLKKNIFFSKRVTETYMYFNAFWNLKNKSERVHYATASINSSICLWPWQFKLKVTNPGWIDADCTVLLFLHIRNTACRYMYTGLPYFWRDMTWP
jgi:hypothetical protein